MSALAVSVTAALALSGCSMGGWVYNANLPGGANLGPDPLIVKTRFSDVLDLVPQSSVKVDNVSVGRVESIALASDGHSALVTLEVNRSTHLPEGTTARLEQTSLLGEKYVALVPPTATSGAASLAAQTPLHDGETLPLGDTSEAADVEEVLGALSLVLNGGGIGQFQQISRELQKVGHGRVGQIRDFLTQIDRFVASLNDRKEAITSALDGLDRLSTTLKANDNKIATTLDGISPGLKVLAEQRPQLVRLLKSLDRLSNVTVSTLHRSQTDIVADLNLLEPILSELADSGQNLPNSLQILLTYPFPDSVLGAIKGDYLNTFMTTNFRTVPAGCAEEGCAWPQVGGGPVGDSDQPGGNPPSAAPSDSGAPPALLPSTDSPLPGATTSSVPAPSILPASPSGTPSAPASSGTPSSGPSSSSTSPSSPSSPPASGSSSGSPSSSASDPSDPDGSQSPDADPSASEGE